MTSINPSILPAVSFRVAQEQKDINTNVRYKWIKTCCDQTKKISLMAWDVFSIIILPVGLVRVAGRIIAPQIVLPAGKKFNLEMKKERIKTLEERIANGKNKIEKEIAAINEKINAIPENQPVKKEKFEKEILVINQRLKSFVIENEILIHDLNELIYDINVLHEVRNEFLSNNSNAEQITVQTSDGVEIDTVRIKNDQTDKWVIYFCLNASCYEQHLDELKKISEVSGANVYSGNYRGVMRSKGRAQSTNDMILDGKAMVQKLLSEGVPQENILIQGWSIGGGVATEVASNYPKVHHCNLSSFGSLSSVIKAHVPVIGSLLGAFASITGWRFNSAENFQKIEGKKLVIYSKSDAVIPYKSSLFKMLKNKNVEFDSIEIKAQPERSDYIKNWKEKHPDINPEKANKQAKKDYIQRFGSEIHSQSFTSSKEVFEGYIKFVKEALQLAG